MSTEVARANPLYDPKIRGIVWQVVVCLLVVWLIWTAASNAAANLKALNKNSGLGFWDNTASFDISIRLISYEATSSYGRAFLVGLINTLFVSALGIVLATILGFFIGIARLSKNFMISVLAAVYVECVRNTPLLLQLLIWYNAVLKPLPEPRGSISIPFFGFGWPSWLAFLPAIVAGGAGAYAYYRPDVIGIANRSVTRIVAWVLMVGGAAFAIIGGGLVRPVEGVFFLNNRGFYLPEPAALPGLNTVFYAFIIGAVAAGALRFWAKWRQEATGQQFPVGLATLGLVVGLPLLVFLLLGRPIEFSYPQQTRFNLNGGLQIRPEFVALLLGLVIYTAAFIAENVRAGIQSVSKGQTEAAYALGLRPGPTTKMVIIPQAMRVIIPPLTSQYLNLTKNSSLATAVAYPDLVHVFFGTVLNQTQQEIEVIAITMLVYLTISLTTSLFMNWYNARKALVER